MKTGARLAIQTDHAEYFEQMCDVTAGFPQLKAIDWADEDYGIVGEDIRTNFEIKYEREGRTFHRLAFRCDK